MIIRVKEEPEVDESKNSGENSNKQISKRSKESKENNLGQNRKRKLSHKRKSMEEKDSKVASFEVLKPTTPGQIPGMPWPTSQQNYPALVQQLYHQLYQMQQQLQAHTPHRHSNSMPPPMPPPNIMSQQNLESYQTSSGQYLTYHPLQQHGGKGKDRGAMLMTGNGSPHLKNSGVMSGNVKPRRTPGTGRGRRAKNGEGRIPKKVSLRFKEGGSSEYKIYVYVKFIELYFLNFQQQAYPINAAMPGTNNFTIVSGDSIPIQIEDSKIMSSLKVSHTSHAVSETTTESIVNTTTGNANETPSTVDNTDKSPDERNSIDSKECKLEKPGSNSTLQQVEMVEVSKKAKLSKSTIGNQQSTKQQPHIIRHHASSHTQNLQLISSSPATQRPKLPQASITPTIRSMTQNIAVVSNESLVSPKGAMAVNLATESAKDLSTKKLIHTTSCNENKSDGTESAETSKFNKLRGNLSDFTFKSWLNYSIY